MSLFRKKKEGKTEDLPSFSISKTSMPVKTEGGGMTAEDIRLIIEEWLKEIYVKFKTRLTKRQVWAVTKLQTVADSKNVRCIQKLLNEYRIAKLSEEGQSAKELVDILRERLTNMMEEKTTIDKGLGKFLE